MIQQVDIWAFVRVMVALEDRLERDQNNSFKALFALWEEEWMEIDQQLVNLADTDFSAYSEMMMNTQISLELTDANKGAFSTLVQALIEDMIGKRKETKDKEFRNDLSFEIDGLTALLKECI